MSGIRGLAEASFARFTFLDPAEHHAQARDVWTLFGPYVIDDSLLPLAVDVACLASITAHDAGAHGTGHAWALRAGKLAARAHSPELSARAAGMASVHKSASHGTAPDSREALRLLEQARAQAPGGVVSVWANLFLAIEHAAAGHRKDWVKALSTADRNLGRGLGHGFFSEAGYLRSFVSPARVAGTTGRCLALLGDGKRALEELGAALSPQAPDGRYALVLHIDTVLAYVTAGQPEAACQGAVVALEECQGHGYQLGIDRLRAIREQFSPRWDDLACVRDLDERLALA
ncbi:MAG: hypothetical protein ACRDYA_22520 [Egibacteraceae bacterium]